jgi:hypothetical protein
MAGAQPYRLGPRRCAESTTGALPVRVGMVCVPTLFDASDPQVLNKQPRCADDESGTGRRGEGQTDIVVPAGECRQARYEQHEGHTDHDKSRHDFVVLHRFACVRPRCPRVVHRIFRALHRYSSLGIPTPAKHGLTSTVELPEAFVGETDTEVTSLVGLVLAVSQHGHQMRPAVPIGALRGDGKADVVRDSGTCRRWPCARRPPCPPPRDGRRRRLGQIGVAGTTSRSPGLFDESSGTRLVGQRLVAEGMPPWDYPLNRAGPASAGMLIASISSINANSIQPAPCQAHHVSRLRHV